MTKIYLYRHAESTGNISSGTSFDVPITENGKKVASKLEGEYDLVICSIMKRAQETLLASKLKYKNILISNLCREFINADESPFNNQHMLEYEDNITETQEQLKNRITEFKILINILLLIYPKIAVISHGYYLNTFRGVRGKFANCEMVEFDL